MRVDVAQIIRDDERQEIMCHTTCREKQWKLFKSLFNACSSHRYLILACLFICMFSLIFPAIAAPEESKPSM